MHADVISFFSFNFPLIFLKNSKQNRTFQMLRLNTWSLSIFLTQLDLQVVGKKVSQLIFFDLDNLKIPQQPTTTTNRTSFLISPYLQ